MFVIKVVAVLSICDYNFKPEFSIIGGSNTAGANAVSHKNKVTKWGKPHMTFAKQFSQILPQTTIKYGADGGRGPIFLSACSREFISNNTRYASVEYLPNIGYLKDENAEIGSVKNLLKIYNSLGALTFVINILSGSARYQEAMSICGKYNSSIFQKVIGCMTRDHIEKIRDKIVEHANITNSHVIEVDANKNPELFGADMFHLNQNGHDFVFKKMWEHYNSSSCLKPNRKTHYTNTGVYCKHGHDIKNELDTGYMLNLSPRKEYEKIAVEPLIDNITLTIPMPNITSSFENPIIWNSVDKKIKNNFNKGRFKIGLGFHTSKNSTYGIANILCEGCNCDCQNSCNMNTYTESIVSITRFKTLLTNDTKCKVILKTEKDKKIYLRDLIVGLNDFRTKWLH